MVVAQICRGQVVGTATLASSGQGSMIDQAQELHDRMSATQVVMQQVGDVKTYTIEPAPPDAHKILWIRRMVVSNNWQRWGIGTALLRYLEECAMDAGGTMLKLLAKPSAEDFYKKSGFSVKETSQSCSGDVLIMEKKIR